MSDLLMTTRLGRLLRELAECLRPARLASRLWRLPVAVLTVVAVALAATTGCGPRSSDDPPPMPRPFHQNFQAQMEDGYLLVLAIDTSPSFADELTSTGRAYQHAVQIVEQYFRARLGTQDEVLVTQLSGNANPLVFMGKPLELMQRFPDANAFRKELLKKATPGSRLMDGVSDSLETVLAHPGVLAGKKRVVLCCLTDWEDNVNTPRSLPRLKKNLQAFASVRSAAGFFFVRQDLVRPLQQLLHESGLQHFLVEPDFKAAVLPSFDDL